MGSNARIRRNSVVGKAPVEMIARFFYDSRALFPEGFLLDLAQFEKGSCFRNKRYPGPSTNMRFAGREVDEFNGT
jgi:hypothetical protein